MSRRAVVVVADACGAGALPDAAAYGDAGANTLAHVAEAVGGLELPTLERLGLGAILPLRGVAAVEDPPAVYGRLGAQGPGKDSTAGHWELMGVVVDEAPPTYPAGVPAAEIARLASLAGRDLIGGETSEGIAVLERLGPRHLQTGELILYTSADSVLQLAAHVDVLAPEELYAACRGVRAGTDVGRVIARPFKGAAGSFARTDGRRDFALDPPRRSYLDALAEAGVEVDGVGKVTDLFAGRGITRAHPAPDNVTAIAAIDELIADRDGGFVFANLIDTDQVHGHRKDTAGFHRALQELDAALARWLELLGDGDLLVVTADHGVDPDMVHTDHTREYAPLIAVAGSPPARGRHDGALADVGATVHRWLTAHDAPGMPGIAFL